MKHCDKVLGGGFRERSDDYLPEGYIVDNKDSMDLPSVCMHFMYDPEKHGGRCPCGFVFPSFSREELDWLISLCCRSG